MVHKPIIDIAGVEAAPNEIKSSACGLRDQFESPHVFNASAKKAGSEYRSYLDASGTSTSLLISGSGPMLEKVSSSD